MAALRWRQLFEKVRQTPISLKVLYDALRSVEAKWEGDLLSKGEVRIFNLLLYSEVKFDKVSK